MPIEHAHAATIRLLHLVRAVPFGRRILRAFYGSPPLEREVFGLKFHNPVGLAAGFDRNAEVFDMTAALGFGFVEVGAITAEPQAGMARPRIFGLPRDRALVERMGAPNHGLERALKRLRHRKHVTVVGANLCGPPDHLLRSFRNLYQYVDYFTINPDSDPCREISAPYSAALLEPLLEFRRGQTPYRPVLLKVSADVTDAQIDALAALAAECPLDGFVAVSGTFSRTGLHASQAALERVGAGRLSGAPLHARAVDVVRRLHERSKGLYPIIGAGGIFSADDARDFLNAGAALVQVYTGLIYEGPALAKRICKQLL